MTKLATVLLGGIVLSTPLICNASASPLSNAGCADVPPVCLIYDSWNRDGVGNAPTSLPVFSVTNPTKILEVSDYHWNAGFGQDPAGIDGQISIYNDATDALVGSWSATSDARHIFWFAEPDIVLAPGSYRVVDSDPATWSYSLTNYAPLPGDGPDWKPGVGFSAILATVAEPDRAVMVGTSFMLLLGITRRKRRPD